MERSSKHNLVSYNQLAGWKASTEEVEEIIDFLKNFFYKTNPFSVKMRIALSHQDHTQG